MPPLLPFLRSRLAGGPGRRSGNPQVLLGVIAMLVGLAVGGAIVGFLEAISRIQEILYGGGAGLVVAFAGELPWWQVMLIPTGGGLIVGLLLTFVMPGRRRQGIPEVIEATATRDGRLPWGRGLVAALGAVLSLGSGASVGREGPAVHLGATLAATLGGWLGFARSMRRTLLGCGAAAAVAASFNAPIAGALFAHEVVVGHYAVRAFVPVVISSVAATAVSRSWFGNFPAFVLPEMRLVSFWEMPAFAVLGLLGGLAAVLMMRAIEGGERLAAATRLPPWARPALGGLLLGALAIPFPEVLGVGYEVTDAALQGALPLALIAALAAAKLLATGISLGFGFMGGVFSPSLSIGALLGGTFGLLLSRLGDSLNGLAISPLDSAAYAVVGMGAVAAAVLGAPISTTLIVFEMTANYGLTLGVMVAVVLAAGLSTHLYGHPSFFHGQLQRRGLDLAGGPELHLLEALTVGPLVRADTPTVGPGTPLPEVRRQLLAAPHGLVLAIDDDNRLLGPISAQELSAASFDPNLDPLVVAADLIHPSPPMLTPEDTLDQALRVMSGEGLEHLPVVEDRTSRRLLGTVRETDLLLYYNRELFDHRAAEHPSAGKRPFS
ncbi:chloride channel protein [Roseospirillum parvum]|uniref:Chloride channel protein, CIC family n=1 Tax=Roseospirillum parvum TaxID=83401 RepID=A0A1G8B7U0_9PROT|nr:chloride channel protein [Roseospirillum parvum]SDH28690.1 chloride channel protein, CIC family [Roseospirillum parvum]